jgi:hypothetical protein
MYAAYGRTNIVVFEKNVLREIFRSRERERERECVMYRDIFKAVDEFTAPRFTATSASPACWKVLEKIS